MPSRTARSWAKQERAERRRGRSQVVRCISAADARCRRGSRCAVRCVSRSSLPARKARVSISAPAGGRTPLPRSDEELSPRFRPSRRRTRSTRPVSSRPHRRDADSTDASRRSAATDRGRRSTPARLRDHAQQFYEPKAHRLPEDPESLGDSHHKSLRNQFCVASTRTDRAPRRA